MAAMRSPEITTEAGAWTSSSPRSRPRSGPAPFGETAASRSWMRSETSATFFLPGVDAASGDPRRRHDPAPGPEDQGGGEIPGLHVRDRRMLEVNFDEVRGIPRLQILAPPTRRKQPGGRRVLPGPDQHVPPARKPAGARLYLPELLERVDPRVGVGAHLEPDAEPQDALCWEESVAEVPLGRGARAHARAALGEKAQLSLVRVGGVDHGRAPAEEPRL